MTQHKFIAKNVVPYNTGKVLIGGMWMPPLQTRTMSRDELRIQRALRGHKATIVEALEDALDTTAAKPSRRIANFFNAIQFWK